MIPHENAYAFDEQSVLTYAPSEMGVYFIYRTGKWLYVGHGNVQERLLGHVRGDKPELQREDAMWFMFETCKTEEEAIAREKVLLFSYRPACN
jgi:predicted GIY-YIG superfamily endonuclease